MSTIPPPSCLNLDTPNPLLTNRACMPGMNASFYETNKRNNAIFAYQSTNVTNFNLTPSFKNTQDYIAYKQAVQRQNEIAYSLGAQQKNVLIAYNRDAPIFNYTPSSVPYDPTAYNPYAVGGPGGSVPTNENQLCLYKSYNIGFNSVTSP